MDDIRSILSSVIKNFEDPDKQKRSQLITSWASIAGEKLAKHTRPQLSSKGVLYIYVDEAALAFEISQRYRASFLKRAQAVLGESVIKEIKVLIGK